MRIDRVWHFAGESAIPSSFRDPDPHDLTLEQLEALTRDYAVLLYKYDGQTVIAFDTHHGRFKQR